MNKLYWSEHTEITQEEPISPVRCLIGAAGILLMFILGFVLVVIGLSL